MNTKLVFFGTTLDSKNGTIRGTLGIIIIIVLNVIWFKLTKELYNSYIDNDVSIFNKFLGMSLISLLLTSAVSVQQNPSSVKESAVYGALIGLVVYGVCNGIYLVRNSRYNLAIALIDTLWGVFSMSIVAIILYYVFWKNKTH
jgi:uncharacterized membrane protein